MSRQNALRRLCVFASFLGIAPLARAATGTITISPTSGPPGTMVAVTVKGFTPSPANNNNNGSLYPYDLLLDGTNFVFPGVVDQIDGTMINPAEPFTYTITIPSNFVPGSTHTIDYQHDGNDTSVPAVFTVSGPASQIVLISGTGQILMPGAKSGSITAQLRDSFGTPVLGSGSSGTILTLTTTSSGGKFVSPNGVSPITSIAVPSSANSASFFYLDTTTGSPTLTVAGTGLTSAATTFTISPPAPTVPSAPSIVTATAVNSGQVHVSWSSSPGATGYFVFESSSATGTFTQVNTTASASPFMHSGLLPNTQHFYKVKATNTAGTSAGFSPLDSATTMSAVITGNTTVSDDASCSAIGGTPGVPTYGFVLRGCGIGALTVEAGATLTVQNVTLINQGTLDNAGTINNGLSTNAVSANPGAIVINMGPDSNGGTINNYYNSTFISSRPFNQWCGSVYNNIGAFNNFGPTNVCAGSVVAPATSVTQQVVFMASPGAFSRVTAVAESSLPTAGKPAGVTFPYGLFSWTVTGVATGETVTVRMKFPANVPTGAAYWQVVNGVWTDLTTLVGDNDGDNILTLRIKDGGLEDADNVPGQVSDPGGIAIALPATSGSQTTIIVTLGIAALVAAGAVWVIGRRKTAA